MDPASIAAALISARVGQAQFAVAARLAQQAQSMNSDAVVKLVEAANQNTEALTAAVRAGIGEIVDLHL